MSLLKAPPIPRSVSLFFLALATAASFYAVRSLRTHAVDSDILSLAITLIGTLLGVLFALWIGDAHQYLRDRNRLLDLYDAAEREIHDKMQQIVPDIHLAAALRSRCVGGIEIPRIVDGICADISLHQYFSPTMKRNMFSGLGSSRYRAALELIAEGLAGEDEDGVGESYPRGLMILWCQMGFQRRFINAEHQYLRGWMSAARVANLWQEFSGEHAQQEEQMLSEKWVATDESGNLILRRPEPETTDLSK